MTDREIENLIQQAVEEETPDILEDLLKETGLADPEAAPASGPVKPKRPWRHLYTALITAAAVVLVFTVALNLSRPGMTGQKPDGSSAEPAVQESTEVKQGPEAQQDPEAQQGPETQQGSETTQDSGLQQSSAGTVKNHVAPVFASVCIDVNPSVELSVDTDNRVSACRAVNDDGKKILSKLDLAGTDVATASYALIGVMLTDGYLNDLNNSVLLSVISDDTEHGTELEKALSAKLSSYLDESVVGVAILGQYAKEDAKLQEFAKANGISEGKARIIKELSSSVPRLTEESLLKLSTHELLLIWNDHLVDTTVEEISPESGQSISSYGTVSTGSYISREEAASLAISGIGADPASVSGLKTEFECEDGIIIYEVSFYIGNTKYEAGVDAVTGALLSWESESPDGEHDYDGDDDDDRDASYEPEYDDDGDEDGEDAYEDREDAEYDDDLPDPDDDGSDDDESNDDDNDDDDDDDDDGHDDGNDDDDDRDGDYGDDDD